MSSANQRLKLIYLARILEQETDDEHGLTGPQLIERLAEYGIEVERKTLYRDLDALRHAGYDIQKYQRSPVQYALATRWFEPQELMLMADAVQSSKFLTERKSASLVKSIGMLTSKHQAAYLKKRVHVEGRIKMQNESVFYHLDAIQQAMAAKRKIEFQYFKHDESKKQVLCHNGSFYKETPVQLVYMNDFYYVVTWNDKHQGFANYRVDRMMRLKVSSAAATHNEQIAAFDVAEYQSRTFGMFNGNPVNVTLHVEASAMNAVIDRFGKDVMAAPIDDGVSMVVVNVMETPTFFGWLAQFGTSVTIKSPVSLRKSYRNYLSEIADSYKDE